MTDPHHAVIARLSSDFAAISQYMARVSTDLTALDGLLAEQPYARRRCRIGRNTNRGTRRRDRP